MKDMAVQGHITDPESSEPVIGAEFNAESGLAEVYIDEGAEATEIALSRVQVRQLRTLLAQVENQMEWHEAEWVYAKGPLSGSIHHLMKKGEHDPKGRPLCGQKAPEHYPGMRKWELSPVIGEPWRTSGICKRCLMVYDRLAGKDEQL